LKLVDRLRLSSVFLLSIGSLFLIDLARAQNISPEVQAQVTPIFQAARTAERALNFDEAGRLYDDILRIAPELGEVWANKGLVLLQLERHRDALNAFEKARSLNPRLVVPHVFAGVEYLRFGRARDAVTALRQALEIEPSNIKAQYELARAYMAVESYDRAVSLLSDLVQRNPSADDAWFTLGLAYLQWSRTSAQKLAAGNSPYGALITADADAVAGFQAAARENYRSAMTRLTPEQRAELPVDPNTFRAAPGAPQTDRPDVQWTGLQSGELNLNSAAARAWKSGRYYRALHAANLRLRETSDARALYWLSLACRALARETLRQGIERNPESARAHLVTAQLATDDGDSERALTQFEKAVAADPRNPEVRLMYIQSLASARKSELVARARSAGMDFPTDARIQSELGRALLKNGAPVEALRAFAAAAAADPGLAAAHAGLADANAALGRLEAAISEMRKVLAQDLDGSYHYRIAKWYQQTGHAEEARAAFAETARIKAKVNASLEGRLTVAPAP
jgi:tetratricopeptide (TPR) repeat protein